MIKEGLPHPSCLHLSIVTCHSDQHNDVLQRISKNEHQNEEKLLQRNDSPLIFVFYVRAWYVFYASDPPFLQILLFFMHLHWPPEHRTSKHWPLLYCPFLHCLTEYYLPSTDYMITEHRILDNRTTAYRRTDFQLTAYLHRLTAYQHTNYRSIDHRFTGYQSTDYQSTDYLFTDYQSTDYKLINYRSTDYQSTGYGIINYRSTGYQPTTSVQFHLSTLTF